MYEIHSQIYEISNRIVTRPWQGKCSEGFGGYIVSVWNDEKALKMDSGDGCITSCQ